MPLVKALNSHPYRGRMYTRGNVYEAKESDVDLLKSLKRVEIASDADSQVYRTRDMRSGRAGIVTTRGTVAVTNHTSDAQVSTALNEAEPARKRGRPAAEKPTDTQ